MEYGGREGSSTKGGGATSVSYDCAFSDTDTDAGGPGRFEYELRWEKFCTIGGLCGIGALKACGFDCSGSRGGAAESSVGGGG